MTLLELLPFVAVLLVAWLLLFRPAKARRVEHDRLVAALAPGARIMTSAGVFGTVRSVDADRMTVEIAPGVVIEMVPQAVGRIEAEPQEADGPAEPTVAGETPADGAEADRG